MIYLDSSVLLAYLLAEDRRPPAELWRSALPVTSRLTEFEVWNRLHFHRASSSATQEAVEMFADILLIEMAAGTLARARDPFPKPVKTLDGLHLATIHYLRSIGEEVRLATYDGRLASAAEAMGVELAQL